MTKRMNNKNSYKVMTVKADYIVTLERLKNTYSGNPRFEASIMIVKDYINETTNSDYIFTVCYRFNGHYMNEQNEAKWIVEHYEKRNAKVKSFL